jgi:hypothetical protein
MIMKTKRNTILWPVIVLVAALTLMVGTTRAELAFGTPRNLGAPINTPGGEWGASITADGLSLFFNPMWETGYGWADLYVSTRASVNNDWGAPVNLGPEINGESWEGGQISADGLTLYFGDGLWGFPIPPRPGGLGSGDLWMTTRPSVDDAWTTPVNLGAPVNSPDYEGEPSVSRDGLSLYFSSTRPGSLGDSDLWVATRPTTDAPWGKPVHLAAPLSSEYHDCVPHVSPDGLMLFFNSTRPGGYGKHDMYVVTRVSKDDAWGEPVLLGPPVNTVYEDAFGSISPDGSTLYFCSDRPGGVGGWDVWQVPILPTAEPSLEGAWICTVPIIDPNGVHVADLLSEWTLSPQNPEGTRFTSVLRQARPNPTFWGNFPEADHETDWIGQTVKTGANTFASTVMSYGSKKVEDQPLSEIVYMSIMYGTGRLVDADTIEAEGTHAVYLPDQDSDGDGFPDGDQEPIACFPYTVTCKRIRVIPPCALPPMPEEPQE